MKRQRSEMMQMRLLVLSWLLIAALILPGCNAYVIQGKVVQGPISAMYFVSNDDTQLDNLGIVGTQITIYRDPDSLGTKIAGSAVSDDHGRFVISLDAFGAGWMLEQWRIVAQKQGFTNAFWQQSLTTDNQQQAFVITMTPGHSQPVSRDALWKQYEKLLQPDNSKTDK